MIAFLRSLVFYPLFYLGSVLFVLGCFVTMPFSRRVFKAVVAGWSGWHRLCARVVLGIRVVVTGEIPTGNVLIAMKHESFFEAIDLPNLLDYPVVFAKAELLRIPGWGAAGAAYGLVGVERDKGATALRTMIKAARELMAEGRPAIIFPEGTRVPHGTERALQSGFAGLYKLLGVPVVPIAVDSGPIYHRRWKRAGTIHYLVGEEIPTGLPREEVEARVLTAINALNTKQ
ncbi:MAG: lysophospholipid acyltransferase family protein [Sphingomonadaceae bacterium]|jgi:1-acyl-sn-glycerol-3-phosphate acyltransferase